MLLNQTDVVVDKDLEKFIITTDSSTEVTMSRATSTLPEKLQKRPEKKEACLQLERMYPVPNSEI